MNILVTITYNALRDGVLEPFLECIRAQSDQDFLLLVIDNASADGTVEYLRALDMPNLRLILNDANFGFARACNQGIAFARDHAARYITFINNDTEFGPDMVGNMAVSLDASGAAGLSPLITLFAEPDRIWFATGSFSRQRGIVPIHDGLGEPRSTLPSGLLATPFAPGCCLMLRMEVFDTVSGFDERFFVYWEDIDLCRTLGERGMHVVVDTAIECRHKVSVSTGGATSDFSVLHFTRGHMVFARKHLGGAALAWIVPTVAAKIAFKVLTGRMQVRQLPIWWRGLTSGLVA